MRIKAKTGELFLEINFHQKEVELPKPRYVFLSDAVGVLRGVGRRGPCKQVVSSWFALGFVKG